MSYKKTEKDDSTRSWKNTWSRWDFFFTNELGIILKNQIEILPLKYPVNEIKNIIESIRSTVEKMKDWIRELEDRTFQITSFSVADQLLSYVWLFVTHGLQHARFPCPLPSPGACSNSCPLSRWCHPTILSSVISLSSCLQSFPVSGSFLTSQLFASGGQSTGISASASFLPMNIQDWFPLGLTGLISLQSKGLSRVFSNTTVQKHPFFSAQSSLWSTSHMHTWLLEKP